MTTHAENTIEKDCVEREKDQRHALTVSAMIRDTENELESYHVEREKRRKLVEQVRGELKKRAKNRETDTKMVDEISKVQSHFTILQTYFAETLSFL
jgi:hypothetical protein